jgi:outer membrane protein OmpA-like peptidoglycan-associated protein
MTKILKLFLLLGLHFTANAQSNTDRAGEAGAYELLINPHARTMGMMGVNSASVKGVDAMGTNIAGLAMNRKVSAFANYTNWLVGTETSVMNLGTAFEVSPGNNFGFNVNFMSFGDLTLTTVDNPEGIGTFSPYMLNLGFSFARRFSKYVNGGIQLKLINEGISTVTASGFGLDAGLQYTTGDLDDVHFGVYIRNVGFPMTMSGDGLTIKRPDPSGNYEIPYNLRAAKYELPTQFSLALTKDLYFGDMPTDKVIACRPAHRLSVSGNFIYNAFINNEFGVGGEYSFKEKYSFRLGYLYQDNAFNKEATRRAHMGVSAGFSLDVPMSKDKNPSTLEISYNYRPSWVFQGTHNLGFTYFISKYSFCDDYEEVKKKTTTPEVEVKQPKVEPKIVYKTDTVKIQLPPKIETVVQYKDVNKIFKDFSQSIEFKTGSAQLTPKGSGALDVIGDLMRNYPESRFNIAGHTDEMGKAENNLTLSKNRANAVAKYLITNKSIPDNSLSVEWFGQEKPVADNKTEIGRSKNRRVEITVIDNGNLKSAPIQTTPKNAEPVKFESPIDNKPKEIKNESSPINSNTTDVPKESSLENDLKEDAKVLKFFAGTDSILRVGKIRLTKIAALLSDATYSQLKIVSHTDKGSYSKSNMDIATNRSNVIKDILIQKGISADKIVIDPKGDTMPIDTSDSTEAIEKNNRIELILIK